MRHLAHVDSEGQHIERQVLPSADTAPLDPAQPVGSGILWQLVDAASITESVAVADATDESWVGHNLNFQITTRGTGSFQDTVAGAQASADGQTFAVVSWGTRNNVHPEVQVFDRDLALIAGIDTPGSPFSVDMTRDGRHVVVGSKAVHANDLGSGSNTYALGVPVACPWDCADGTARSA